MLYWTTSFFDLPTGCNTCREITGCSTRLIFQSYIKMSLEEWCCAAFIWLRIASGKPLWTWHWNFGFHKRGEFLSSRASVFSSFGAAAQHGLYPPHSLGFSRPHTRRNTVGKTPLDEWSARRRDLYLTTHNTQIKQISMPSSGIRTHNLSRRAAADLRLRPRGHWHRQLNGCYLTKITLPLKCN